MPNVALDDISRRAFLQTLLTRTGGTIVDKNSLLHFASCKEPLSSCARCKFVRNADKWSSLLTLGPVGGVHAWRRTSRRNRTWLQWREGFGAGCVACHAAGLTSPLALHTVKTSDALQIGHLLKHHALDSHIQAAAAFVDEDGELSRLSAGAGAPSPEAFEKMISELRKGVSASAGMEGVGQQQKITKMIWCVREAIQDMDRDFLARSVCTTLCRDERHGRLAIRYAAIDGALNIRHGRLGQRRHFGTGALAITNATRDVMVRAMTARTNAPFTTPASDARISSSFSEASGEGNN